MTRAASVSPPEADLESLRSAADFRSVLRHGVRTRAGGLTMASLRRDHSSVRIGLVAGRRLGNAVARNRIKRRIRHACRHIEFEPGWDHVVIPGPSAATVAFDDLVDWLDRAARAASR